MQKSNQIVKPALLDEQLDDFVTLMAQHSERNTELAWKSFLTRSLVADSISEYCKLGSIMLVIPVGSVQNETAFSQMKLIQIDIRNRLKEVHLNVAMMIRRTAHDLDSLPLPRCLSKFNAMERRGCRMAV